MLQTVDMKGWLYLYLTNENAPSKTGDRKQKPKNLIEPRCENIQSMNHVNNKDQEKNISE